MPEVAETTAKAAAVETPVFKDIAELTSAERTEWLKTGTIPAKEAKAPTADASVSAPDKAGAEKAETPVDAIDEDDEDDAAEDDAAAAGKSPKAARDNRIARLKRERAKFKSEAAARAAEVEILKAEVEKLKSAGAPKAEIAAAQEAVKDAKADAVVAPKEKAKHPQGKPEPKMEDFTGDTAFQDWLDARDEWRYEVRKAAEQEAAQRTEKEQSEARVKAEQEKSWKTRTDAAREVHPDFDEKISAAETREFLKTINPIIDAFVLKDPQGAEVLYLLVSDLSRASEISKMDAFACHEELIEMRRSLKKKEAGDGAKEPTPKPPVPRANKPVAPIAGRSIAAADPVESAVEKDDVATYMRERNAREAAAKKG